MVMECNVIKQGLLHAEQYYDINIVGYRLEQSRAESRVGQREHNISNLLDEDDDAMVKYSGGMDGWMN